MKIESSLSKKILNLEEKLLLPDVRKSPQEISKLLAEEFVEFGSSGRVYTKQQVIDSLQNEFVQQISIDNFKTINLAPDVVLATYTAVKKNKSEGETTRSLRSSIWKLSDNEWRLVFHQGTPVINI